MLLLQQENNKQLYTKVIDSVKRNHLKSTYQLINAIEKIKKCSRCYAVDVRTCYEYNKNKIDQYEKSIFSLTKI